MGLDQSLWLEWDMSLGKVSGCSIIILFLFFSQPFQGKKKKLFSIPTLSTIALMMQNDQLPKTAVMIKMNLYFLRSAFFYSLISLGLGKNSEGRIEPVQAVVLPKGKSLDQCLAIQQRKKKGGGRPPRTRKKRAPKMAAAGRGKPNHRNVFDFLNEKLEGQNHKGQPTGTKTNLERKGKEVYNASQSSKRALSIELAKTIERTRQKQREIAHIAESLARNVGR